MFDFSQIEEVKLAEGAHISPDDGLCFMEMAAWFAGESHSDKPECACPVLGAYGIGLNDRMPDDIRDSLLKPLVPLIVGTRDPASEQKRVEFIAMWAVNRIVPVALREAGMEEHALACERAKTLGEAIAAAEAARAAANAATHAAEAARAAHAALAAAWPIAVEGLRQAILLGRHDGFADPEPVIIERRERLRELVHCGKETNR